VISRINAPPIYTFENGIDKLTKILENIMVEEGSVRENTLRMRKRSTQLVQQARKNHRVNDVDGKLRCAVCGYVKPNKVEREIVHIHHIEQLMEKDENGENIPLDKAVKNTVPLCPTCHAVTHSENPPLSIEILKMMKNTKRYT